MDKLITIENLEKINGYVKLSEFKQNLVTTKKYYEDSSNWEIRRFDNHEFKSVPKFGTLAENFESEMSYLIKKTIDEINYSELKPIYKRFDAIEVYSDCLKIEKYHPRNWKYAEFWDGFMEIVFYYLPDPS